MTDVGPDGYGLGLGSGQFRPGQPDYGHDGNVFGYLSFITIQPDSGDILVVMVNTDQIDFDQLVHDVLSIADELGVCWWTIMNAVIEHGTPLVEDPERVGPVHQLGVDETSFLAANRDHATVYVRAIGADGDDWKHVVRQRILAAREVLLRHRWAPGVMETRRTSSRAVMRYYDDLLGLLRRGGFSNDLAHHALHVLGSRALGFTQELFEPDDDGAGGGVDAAAMLGQMADQFPNIAGMVMEVSHGDPANTLGWCDDQFEFEFALDLILEGLERRRDAPPSASLANPAPRSTRPDELTSRAT